MLVPSSFNNEPTLGLNATLPLANILGGEVAMWSEEVDDSNLDYKVWPRAAPPLS